MVLVQEVGIKVLTTTHKGGALRLTKGEDNILQLSGRE